MGKRIFYKQPELRIVTEMSTLPQKKKVQHQGTEPSQQSKLAGRDLSRPYIITSLIR